MAQGAHIIALAAAAIVWTASTPAAQAQVVDFSRVNCAQFNRLPAAQKRQIALWLHGYYTGAAQRPFLDMAGAETSIRALVETCSEKPETPLLGDEARSVLSGVAREGAPRTIERTIERSPGHIVIEPSAPAEGATTRPLVPGAERPRPVD
ncbi:MAG: HdeA family protein [Microvirga sp.]|nr:HdeA family protein [Microvirga sp.]